MWRFSLSLSIAALALSACQINQTLGVLRIAPESGPAISSGESALGLPARAPTSIATLRGTVLFGTEALSGTQIVAKDAINGEILGAGTTDDHGVFELSILTAPSARLIQLVAEREQRVVQALVAVQTAAIGTGYRALDASTDQVVVDWSSTVIARAIGAKIAEIFLAEGDSSQQAQTLLADAESIAEEFDLDADSFDEFQKSTLSTPKTRQSLEMLVATVNERVLNAFRVGNGPIFKVLPVEIAEAALKIPPPIITIDTDKRQVTITYKGKTDTITISATSRVLDSPVFTASLVEEPSVRFVPASGVGNGKGGIREGRGNSSSGGGSSSGGSSASVGHEKRKMWISDVVLAGSGESIAGENAPASIAYDATGSIIRLTLTGKLNADHPPSIHLSDYEHPGFPFPGLIQQTFVDHKPLRRVLLDDSILLPVDPNAQVSDNELTVLLDTRGLIDLAVPGQHSITVIDRESTASTQIAVTSSSPASNLQPIITKLDLVRSPKFKSRPSNQSGDERASPQEERSSSASDVRLLSAVPRGLTPVPPSVATSSIVPHFSVLHDEENEEGKEMYLKLEGFNFPVSYYMHWAQVNGVRTFAHSTWIKDSEDRESTLFIHIPEDMELRPEGQNALDYATPFGFKFLRF